MSDLVGNQIVVLTHRLIYIKPKLTYREATTEQSVVVIVMWGVEPGSPRAGSTRRLQQVSMPSDVTDQTPEYTNETQQLHVLALIAKTDEIRMLAKFENVAFEACLSLNAFRETKHKATV